MPLKSKISKKNEKDEYFLQHPSKQTFYKVFAFVSGILGLNTEFWEWYHRSTSKLYDVQRYIVIIFVPITSFSQILYLYLHYKEHEFAALAVMFSIMPVAFVVMIKSAAAQTPSYKKAIAAFMDKIHLINYKHIEGYSEHKRKYICEKIIQAEKYTRWTFTFFMTFVFICYCAWNIVPILHNIRNNPSIHNITVRLEVCVHFWQPFDYEFNFYAYLFIQILGVYCGGVAVILMVLFDTINLAFIYHLVGHIKIIKYDLRTGFTENMSNEKLKSKLVDLTKYYCFITDTFQDVEAAFGLNVASVYAQNLIQGGLLLYQLMTTGKDLETLLTFGLMIPIFVGILLLISLVLENVRIQAEDIPTLVYSLPWETMSVANQKILLSILFQVQPTLEFKAAFNIKTGVQPAINIIKTTFSYYVMISQSRM